MLALGKHQSSPGPIDFDDVQLEFIADPLAEGQFAFGKVQVNRKTQQMGAGNETDQAAKTHQQAAPIAAGHRGTAMRLVLQQHAGPLPVQFLFRRFSGRFVDIINKFLRQTGQPRRWSIKRDDLAIFQK